MLFWAFCLSILAQELKPSQIVSINLASDEVLLTLLDAKKELWRLAAISRLADNADYSNVRDLAKKIPHRSGNNIESLLALKPRPDLVVTASFNSLTLRSKIKEARINTYGIGELRSFTDIRNLILDLAKLIQAEDVAKAHLEQLESKLVALVPLSKPVSILYYDTSGVQVGAKTLLTEMIEKTGARNIIADKGIQGWPKVSKEFIAQLNPDFILVCAKSLGEAKEKVRQNRSFAVLPAFKSNKFLLLEASQMYATSFVTYEAVLKLHTQLLAWEKVPNQFSVKS